MSGINKVILVGYLGRDPELRRLPTGASVCRLSVATSRRYKNNRDEAVDETEWHRVSVWGSHGEHCHRYLASGRQVYIEGRLRTSNFEKDGRKMHSTEIVAEVVQFLGGRGRQDAQEGPSE